MPIELIKAGTLWLATGAESIGAVVIGLGVVEGAVRVLAIFLRPRRSGDSAGEQQEAKESVRLHLGRWLAVALEFELAADILNTAVTPSWTDIAKLAAIATLRTALNYFLEREIEQESKPSQIAAEQKVTGPAADVLNKP